MTVLITGANRGIGLEFTRQYARDGYGVIATCRSPEKAHTLSDIARTHPGVQIVQLDVTNPDSVEKCAAELGDRVIDVLINNAGHYGVSDGRLENVDPEDWKEMFTVNTVGPLLVTRALLPGVKRSAAGKVIGISSVKASITRNAMGASYQYRATKAAFNAVLRSLAVDLAPEGIAVTALSPGWVDQDEDVTDGLDFDDRLRKGRKFLEEFGDFSARQNLGQSVTRMRKLIDSLDTSGSGSFLDHHGESLPW